MHRFDNVIAPPFSKPRHFSDVRAGIADALVSQTCIDSVRDCRELFRYQRENTDRGFFCLKKTTGKKEFCFYGLLSMPSPCLEGVLLASLPEEAKNSEFLPPTFGGK
jgi:hypothetical protein